MVDLWVPAGNSSRGWTVGLVRAKARVGSPNVCVCSQQGFRCFGGGIAFVLTLILVPGLGHADTLPAEARFTIGRPPRPAVIRVVPGADGIHVQAEIGSS